MKTKRTLVILLVLCLLAFSFSGCAAAVRNIPSPLNPKKQVEYIFDWSFQYDEEINSFSLFFGFKDENEKEISANATVDIRIENDLGEIVYRGQKSVTERDFSTWTSPSRGDRFLARIKINPAEVKKGKSSSGKVYLTVCAEDLYNFEEVNCEAYSCLPLLDVQVSIDKLPVEIKNIGYDKKTDSKIEITKVTYIYNTSYTSPILEFTISGSKTYQRKGALSFDCITYKLLDHEGYIVDSGTLYIGTDLSVGDKFKEDSLRVYSVVPGESYTLVLTDYNPYK